MENVVNSIVEDLEEHVGAYCYLGDCFIDPHYRTRGKTGAKDTITSSEGRTIEVYDYVQSGDKMKRKVVGHAMLIAMERKEFPVKTVFPQKFPVPVVCSEYCEKVKRCNLRGSGFEDLCKYHHKLGKLVMPVDIKWSVRFNMQKDLELKEKTMFTKSAISGIIPEIALAHERTEDKTFAAYSSQQFLDTWDDPQDGCELEYTMDTGMSSPDKSQAAFVPSFLYRIVYRDRKVLLGFEAKRVEKTYVETERKWERDTASGNFSYREVPVVKTISYRDDVPVYKWIRIPTLRPIGCYLNRGKVVGSSTIVTRKERKFGQDRSEVERQTRRHEKVLIAQDEIDARKQVVLAAC